MNDSSSERIVRALQRWIEVAPPGAQLPSTRQLVTDFGASPVTVQQAMKRLGQLGLVEARPGVGTFVRATRAAKAHDYGWQTAALGAARPRLWQQQAAFRTAPNDVIALHAGYPDPELLPVRMVRQAFARAARGDTAVHRPSTAGMPELQSWFAAELGAEMPAGLTPPGANDVIVLPGSQSGLSTLFRSLVGAGQPLLIESPSYWGAMLAAAQVGVHLVPIPTGPLGPDPADIDRAFAQTGARAFYAQPNFANPIGGQWSAGLSHDVLEIVRRHRAFLIEDDWAHDFGITTASTPLATRDDNGHVIYIRSLTKSVSPAVRVAGLIARGPARERILADAAAQSMYVSGLLQAVALDVVTQPAWRTHLRSLSTQLAARRDLLIDALAQHAPDLQPVSVPLGGLNLWTRVSQGIDLQALLSACESRGVMVAAGDDWFPAEPTGPHLRLNFAGPNPGSYPEAARRLSDALTQVSP